MTIGRLLFFVIALAGWSPALAEDASADSESTSINGNSRSLRNKLCIKLGLCGGGGYGGYSGYQGFGGNQGYGGYQGYNQGYPPINIAVSQSQSSANEGGSGYGSGYYPNNYQFNGGYQPYGGYSGYPNGYQGYGGYRPGYNNGLGGYNSQFNGNYYSGYNGYGFQGPFGYRGFGDVPDKYGYDEEFNREREDTDNSVYGRSSATAQAN